MPTKELNRAFIRWFGDTTFDCGLQSYVLPNGEVRYNAVWRPANMAEIQVSGYACADYRKKYELWPQGWRLYVLDSYVMPERPGAI